MSAHDARTLLTEATARAGDRPALTYRHAGTGERTEFGYRTFANWVTKAADACNFEGLTPDETCQVATDGHWAGLVAVWAAGLLGATALLDTDGQGRSSARPPVLAVLADGRATSTATRVCTVGTGLGGRRTDGAGEAFVDLAASGADVLDLDGPGPQQRWLDWPAAATAPGSLLAAGPPATQAQVCAAAAAVAQACRPARRALLTVALDSPEGVHASVAAVTLGAQLIATVGSDPVDWARIAGQEHADVLLTDRAGLAALLARDLQAPCPQLVCLDAPAAGQAEEAAQRWGVPLVVPVGQDADRSA